MERIIGREDCHAIPRTRVTVELNARGVRVSEKSVARCMKERGTRARTAWRFIPQTTHSDHGHVTADNVLDRQFDAPLPDRKWVCDITYVPTGEGWLYLAGVMDLCSRRIVGWSMADHMRNDLVSDALSMALAPAKPRGRPAAPRPRGPRPASKARP